MLPVERQAKIKELLEHHQHMKISDLSDMLHVSDMTVHRDLKPLIDQGFVMKTFGGVTLKQQPKETPPSDTGTCIICRRPWHERLAYRLILSHHKMEIACCAHCGLMRHQQLGNTVIQAMCHDFLKQTTISAPAAWYVMNTSIHVGCCQPQVLAFEQKEHAEKFTKGFQGAVYTFEEAMHAVHEQMNGGSCK